MGWSRPLPSSTKSTPCNSNVMSRGRPLRVHDTIPAIKLQSTIQYDRAGWYSRPVLLPSSRLWGRPAWAWWTSRSGTSSGPLPCERFLADPRSSWCSLRGRAHSHTELPSQPAKKKKAIKQIKTARKERLDRRSCDSRDGPTDFKLAWYGSYPSKPEKKKTQPQAMQKLTNPWKCRKRLDWLMLHLWS